ncbi:hypothetical protein CORC01_08599 [Colletotrichum orchidophilum]|uniref:Uncharacterized protein n=1 Tax=Colletotrichum orchidophilum TaxID=1209926 RepID=A0A1G4B457_9PEZI|nr:uncharacterized protein CORC01_08599 [Colletotrichum orchidophilum]OHE96062.1 hypothetical protein CORC01_08599 [Colletotrichum orchidophilum]
MSGLPAGALKLAPGHPPKPPQGATVPRGPHPPPPPPVPRAPLPVPPAQHVMQRPVAPMVAPMMMPRPMPVQPPNNVIPPELRRKRLVERSDLRNERMTEADAREALSEYVVYRFEKVNDPNEIDDEGNPVKSTWENVIRTEVQDLSKPAITRTIRQLDMEGKTAVQKKMDLTGTQQRQIEKAQSNLDAHNLDRRFCYTMQQISTKIRKLSRDSIEYRQYMAGKEAKKVVVTKVKERKSKKNLLETIAMTVYFKREPRSGEDAMAILKERERELEQQRRLHEQQRQHRHDQEFLAKEHRNALALRQQQEDFQRQFPMPLPAPQPHPPPQFLQGGKQKADVKVVEMDHKKGKAKIYNLASKSSRSSGSSYSDESWSDTELTPGSSATDSSESSRHGRRPPRSRSRGRSRSRSRSRRRRRYHDRPEHYGIKVTRHHTKHDHRLLDDDVPRGRMPTSLPPAPLITPGRADHFEDEIFRPQRMTDRAHDNVLQDIELLTGVGRRRQVAPPPRVIHRQPSFRIVDPEEVVRARHEDDLDNVRRLTIRNEVRFEDRQGSEEDLAADIRKADARRRHLETRFRRPSLERGAFFPDKETYEERARQAKQYMNRYLDNPFEPLGRSGGRYHD